MRTIPLVLFISIALSQPLKGVSSYDNLELLMSLGPYKMWQTNEWIDADTAIPMTNGVSMNFDQYSTSPDWFANVDYCAMPFPCILLWKHACHFVNIYPENKTEFRVVYDDKYGNPPSTGYPRVVYWSDKTEERTTLTLDPLGYDGSQPVYGKTLPLPPGTYHYQYSVRNGQFPDEYNLNISSFVVTSRPRIPDNIGLPESSKVSNSKIDLAWSYTEGDDGIVSYRLYAGTDPESLKLIYTGNRPEYRMTRLAYGTKYFWQIETINQYGVSSHSPLYSFSTIQPPSRAFNYPNPFNPARNQTTNIVFDMADNGIAEINVYTEFGDLCWTATFQDLLKGANEVSYDGKDDGGRTLYNGSYLCMIKKKYHDKEENDRCRILVLK